MTVERSIKLIIQLMLFLVICKIIFLCTNRNDLITLFTEVLQFTKILYFMYLDNLTISILWFQLKQCLNKILDWNL